MKGSSPKLISFLVLLALLPVILFLSKQIAQFASKASQGPTTITVNTKLSMGFLARPWKGIAQGGEELSTFLDNVEPQVKSLGFSYIRIDHLYDGFDVVKVVDNSLVYDWSKLDKLVEKIISVGAKPFFALSYMPPVIAQTDIVSTPRKWSDWSEVVEKTIEHYSGDKKLSGLYYECWNEPDLFGHFTARTYLPLYEACSVGAKNAQNYPNINNFKLGGAATTGLYRNWIDSLLTYAQKQDLRLDYISWHRYDPDPNRHIKDIEEVESFIGNYPYFADTEVIITEWGPFSDNNPVYDSPKGAAHLLAMGRKQLGRINLAFLFSIKDGADPKGNVFWGRWGLFTSDSTGNKPKPRYTALQWLNSLGENRISLAGESDWVTGIASTKNNTIQILLTNYDKDNSYSFPPTLKIIGLENKVYTLRQRFLGGGGSSVEITPTNGEYVKLIALPQNDAVFLELTPKN